MLTYNYVMRNQSNLNVLLETPVKMAGNDYE